MTTDYAEFDDLLGPPPTATARGGSKLKTQRRNRPNLDVPLIRARSRHKIMAQPDVDALRAARLDKALDRLTLGQKNENHEDDGQLGYDPEGGVTLFWLAKAFGLEVSTVRKRLADCPWLRKKTSGYTYSLATAAKYLVPPVMDVEAVIKQMRPGELPEALRATYWDAQLKRQKWEVNAGHLWHSVDVIGVLGEAFQTMKSTMDLWAETLERSSGLTDDQRKRLEQMVDALQDELQDNLVGMAKRKSTVSSLKDSQLLLDGDAEDEDYADLL